MVKNALGIGSLVWITGAGKGIGRALCLLMANQGMTVLASARTAVDLEALSHESVQLSGDIIPIPLDVTQIKSVKAAFNKIESKYGSIDLIVCNAGTSIPIAPKTFTTESFRSMVEVNIMGVINCIAVVLPSFLNRRHGYVAVMSSVAGYRGLPTASAYGATKAALINMCEGLKPDLEKFNVDVSVICPGFVKTPLTDKNDFPMPFIMKPEKAAEKILYGLKKRRFEITFPRRFTYLLKLGRILPYVIYFFLTRRLVRFK